MKKLLVFFAAVCILAVAPFVLNAEEMDATEPSVEVTVSIIDGTPVLAAEKITVTDTDGDGLLTVSDALYCAHEKKYEGGAEAGYSAVPSEYGISLIELWGDDSGSFGYYLNNATPQSLLDTVKSGDVVTAFIYQDTTYYSDAYSYFDKVTANVKVGSSIVLKLLYQELDFETWETVVKPAEGAVITINGKDTEYTVDKDGMVTIPIDATGDYVISAHSAFNIVPPVCVIRGYSVGAEIIINGNVIGDLDVLPTGPLVVQVDSGNNAYIWIIAGCVGVICAAIAVAIVFSKKRGKQ